MPNRGGNIKASSNMAVSPLSLNPDAQIETAFALHRQGYLAEAEVLYQQILLSQPKNFDALQYLAAIAVQKKQYVGAVELFYQAFKIDPNHPRSLNNCGIALKELRRYEEALQCYNKAIEFKSDYAEAYSNRGNVLKELRRYEDALLSFDKAIKYKPDYFEAFFNRGLLLTELKQFDHALLSYNRAIELKPAYAEVYSNRGIALQELRRFVEALASYDQALSLNPDLDFVPGMRLYLKMMMCEWSKIDHEVFQLGANIECGKKAASPFCVLGVIDSLSIQQQAAQIYVKEKYPLNNVIPQNHIRQRHDKIRIGYYSADFRNHPLSHLTAELYELHDRSRFEITAFSFGPNNNDELRKRVESAVDNFLDVQDQSEEEIVILSRKMAIDIAVDLGGFTQWARTRIFASRAANIQVNYLGYPGTMGAEYIDYIIADSLLISEKSRQFYTEKIVYLPNTYMVSDTKRSIASKIFSRVELDLPENGFVFCCFNNSYKITPSSFDSWIRILKPVKGSVLWLLGDNPIVLKNLRKEADKRGVNPERLIFAQRRTLSEHLLRHRSADLFLDTFPYNAHTTANDALWAGLPVVTRTGESFASRVAASLLNAIHIPELITSTQEAYEALAIELACNPKKLSKIKIKLEMNRLTTPLFDTRLFTKNIEEAYTVMYERYHEGLKPDHLYIKQ